MRSSLAPAAGLVFALAACSPELDWRELRPPESGAELMVPCKPHGLMRPVVLAGQAVNLVLHACSAGGQTWGLAFAEVADPAHMGATLDALRSTAMANIGATAPGQASPLAVPGATPNPSSGRIRLSGHLPTGEAVQMEVAVFSRGTKAFQATVLGARLADEQAQTFFASIRFVP
jgi:hypothetical protein